jgi:hypothetical protein
MTFPVPGPEMDDGPARTEQVDHALIDRLGEDEQILDNHPTSQVAARVFQVIVEELKKPGKKPPNCKSSARYARHTT